MIKKKKKTQKRYLTDYNLLIAQDLWQAHYKIFLKILLKEFTKLVVNMDMMKNEKCETYGIKYKGCDCFLEYTNFKDNFIEYNIYFVKSIIK